MNNPTTTRIKPRRARQMPGWIVWSQRVLITLVAAGGVLQPFIAGLFVTGNVSLLLVHVMIAAAMVFFGLLLVVATVLSWRPGHGPGRAVVAPVVLLSLILAQSALGAFRVLEIHFPLAFAIAGISIGLATRTWRSGDSRAVTAQ